VQAFLRYHDPNNWPVLGGWIHAGRANLAWPVRFLASGVVLFSGSIYLMLARTFFTGR